MVTLGFLSDHMLYSTLKHAEEIQPLFVKLCLLRSFLFVYLLYFASSFCRTSLNVALASTHFGFHILNVFFFSLNCSTPWLNVWRNEISYYATSRHFIFLSLWGRAENRFNWPSFCQRTFKVEIKMKWMMHLVHFLTRGWNYTKP